MSEILQKILEIIASNPMVVGLMISVAMKALVSFLQKVDTSGVLGQYQAQFHIAFLVFTFLASVAAAAATGKLETLDLSGIQNLLNTWIPALVAGKVMLGNDGKVQTEKK